MPYIKKENRSKYENELKLINSIDTKGDLEYCIFYLMSKYMQDKDGNYTNLHDTVYAAQHCADEFRRRFLDKREDQALHNNGDIFSFKGENKKTIKNLEITFKEAGKSESIQHVIIDFDDSKNIENVIEDAFFQLTEQSDVKLNIIAKENDCIYTCHAMHIGVAVRSYIVTLRYFDL